MAARHVAAEREELLAKAEATAGATGGAVPDFWGYQTCTEFGYYQTCEVGSKCFYTQGLITLASMADFCYTDYGISIGDISSNVDATNAYYGGSNPRSVRNATSRILYVNGEVDPWHALSVLPPGAGPGLPAIMVPGASHHAWTHPAASTDQASVVAGRVAIRAQIQAWLTGAAATAAADPCVSGTPVVIAGTSFKSKVLVTTTSTDPSSVHGPDTKISAAVVGALESDGSIFWKSQGDFAYVRRWGSTRRWGATCCSVVGGVWLCGCCVVVVLRYFR